MPSVVAVNGDGPRVKRKRLGPEQSSPSASRHGNEPRTSNVFAPFRTIGLVSPTAVPFTALPLGRTTFQITTSVGRSLQTYDLKRGLNLVFITRPQTPGLITATASRGEQVFAAWTEESAPIEQRRKGVWLFQRGKKVDELPIPLDLDEDIVQLHSFGSWIVACCATRIEVWSADSLEHYVSIFPPYGSERSGAVLTGGLCSLPTFTNKVLAGREDGSVEIWNISTAKLVYLIHPPSSETGPVTALQPTPALSLVAIAYMNGRVNIHDIQLDKSIISFNAGQGDQSPITSISFRTDGLGTGSEGRDPGVMATASYNSGNVSLWDLNNGGTKMGTLRNAHAAPTPERDYNDGGISKVEFLAGQAVLVTSGLDNALKTWIFDETPFSPIPRILNSRSGHAAPVTTLNFLPADSDGTDASGKWLLSTAKDRSFWAWSLRRDGQSTELSQGSVQKKTTKFGASGSNSADSAGFVSDFKAPEISCIACCLNRDGGIGALPGVKTLWANAKQLKGKSTATERNVTGWESIVTGHVGEKVARTWYWGRKRAGRWIFETGDGTEVTSVAISPCGTFALIGSAAGGIDMYNLQSGLHRQRFPPRLKKAEAKAIQHAPHDDDSHTGSNTERKWRKGFGKHTAAITSMHIDNLNRTIISSGAEGKIKFWDFSSGLLLHELDWHVSAHVLRMSYHRSNDLLALACKDNRIRILDLGNRRIIRNLGPCGGVVNDLCFSNDGRWVLAVSSDSILRVWDLPTGHLIDAVRLRNPCVALAFSTTGEYLALAHEDVVGIDLWTNTSLFKRVPVRRILDDDVAVIDGPSASGEQGKTIMEGAFDDEAAGTEDDYDAALPTIDQLSHEVTTLSLVPKSRWQTLLHLDLIRERNKPKEPPKAPEKAPFFLPSLQNGAAQSLDGIVSSADKDAVAQTEAERSRLMKMDREGGQGLFTKLLRERSHTQLSDHLKTLPPSSADIEIRSLNPTAPYTELLTFVEALIIRLEEKRDYELVQAWMVVFLKCHGETLQEAISREEGLPLLKALQKWKASQSVEAARLGNLVGYCSGVVGFLRTAR